MLELHLSFSDMNEFFAELGNSFQIVEEYFLTTYWLQTWHTFKFNLL